MMAKNSLLILFTLFLGSLVLLPSAMAETKAYVWTRGSPPAMKKKFFSSKQYRMLDSIEEKQQFEEDGYLPPRERAALFQKLKLDDSLKGMDDMDKDMLVMDARFMKMNKLIVLYPQLSKDQLLGLRRELGVK